jgi:hypothetical protein
MGEGIQMDPATVAATTANLTPEQIAQTQWNIQNTGRIAMHDFKVRKDRRRPRR